MTSGIEDIRQKINGSKPFFALYINCAGRARPYSGTDFEDAEEVQNLIGGSMSLMGFYSGVEIAKINGRMQPLDWTGVLCVLSE
jgi:small ligand-binding sensory domain FIST